MNYQETLEYMFSKLPMYQRVGKAAYKSDLKTSINFDNYLNNPHKNYKTIHIAGTNGKGSVSHMIASVLQEAGYKVGLYTSPHLKKFTERIKISGKEIKEEFVVEFIQKNKEFIEKHSPSFFEMTVFMAFEYFKNEKIDIAVIETGMGGRLDSTNVISPLLSIITNISLDHTTFLGDTIESISREKAGIIKNNTPVVIGETQTESETVFNDVAKKRNSKIIFADKELKSDYSMQTSDFKQVLNIYDKNNNIKYKNITCDLLGLYQRKNIITAICSINQLLENNKLRIPEKQLYEGLSNVVKNTNLKGRWQILNTNPLTVCDTGHNEAGIKEIINQINQTAYKNLYFVFGTVNDKNIDKILSLLPKTAYYIFTQAKIPRAMPADVLYNEAKKYKLNGEIVKDVKQAYIYAKNLAKHNDLIFIGGSTFVVAEVV